MTISAVFRATVPRSARNNNPGNIRKTNIDWDGEVESEDTAFEAFVNPVAGARALARLLTNYKKDQGIDTIYALVSRFAPASDGNDEESYAQQIARAIGKTPDAVIDIEARLFGIMKAIANVEAGGAWFGDATLRAGIALKNEQLDQSA